MEVIVTGPHEVAPTAAAVVLDRLGRLARAATRREPVLGLATGSSPLGLYRELAAAVADGRVDLAGAHGVALDEYVGLPQGHPQSYRSILVREVGERLGVPPDRLEVPDGSGDTLEELETAAAAFERRIAALGGIDLQILGIGANGHLGFNEPGSALASRTRVKRLSDRTREDNARFFSGFDAVPTHSVTQGLGTILEARTLLLLATGEAKARAVAAAVEGPLTSSCPASVLQWHPDVVVVLDEAAAAGLRNREYYAEAAAGLSR
ncbi:glucosamine-6-phosphate deaminase [Intrasporangium sp.]|uniref:glucosamine-6-phosphate deaminase n=1 Tax=Intrasporangium sp. TaxID=1925024 RepID=UPI0029395FC8|nr:glucosamine-6-phosphate deaminase [Intrasporangium sp.]MDV3220529.1 glucosamine-6-phosphate deaminase [Intrasporangium sp.]